MNSTAEKIDANRQILKQLQQSFYFDHNSDAAKRVTKIKIDQLQMFFRNFNRRVGLQTSQMSKKVLDCIKTTSTVVSSESCDVLDRITAFEVNASSSNIIKWKTFVVDTTCRCGDEANYMMRVVQIEEVYSKVSNSLKNYVRLMLLINNYAMKIRSELAIHDVDLLTNWQNSNEVLYREDKLYLFETMRMNALTRNHDDPLVDHFEVKKTLELLHRKYYWFNLNRKNASSNMKQLVREYCESCVVCKRSKTSKHKSYENFQFLLISKFRWADFTMNFVTEFSTNRDWNEAVYDSILVVVDRFTKIIHYVSITKTISAENLTEIFMKKVIKLHNISASVITDRNTIFTLKFYSTLAYCLKIKHKLSTTFHSQIDDQTKKLNVFMKQYLRVYVNFEQDDWVTLLSITEFAYNNSINASTDCSSFEVNLNFSSRISFEEFFDSRIKSVLVKQHAVHLSKLIEMFQKILNHVQIRQKKYANVRMKFMKYVIDDHVWLRSKNIRTKRNRKLEWKQFESFEIFDKIDKQVYKLVLSTRWRIHNVFHVFLLELVKKKKESSFIQRSLATSLTISKWNKTMKTSISYMSSLTLKFSMRANALTISTANTAFIIEFIGRTMTKTKKHENRSSMSSIWEICWRFFIELISASQMLAKSFSIKDLVAKRIRNEKKVKSEKTVCSMRTFISIDVADLFRAFLRS